MSELAQPRSATDYDYVIVGAGSAGCVLAGRLTEDSAVRVLLIEAGRWDRDPWVRLPIGFGRILQKRLHDWGYSGEPEPNVGGRVVECARGKIIGGSSSINAMAYVRGHPADFDRWAASGLDGWSFADVLPYFRRQETWEKGADLYRGNKGPLTVVESRYSDPLSDAYLAAADSLGHPRTDDYNGAKQEGFGAPQFTIRNGRRCSSAVAYLRPALRRPNLDVVVGALAHRVLIEKGVALGVEYGQAGSTHVARAGREVLLCGGVINTPQVLMLSGIGEAAALKQHGIAVAVDHPGVGKNLQDHLYAPVAYARRSTGKFHHNMRLDRLAGSLANAYFRGRGFAADPPSGVMGFIRSDPGQPVPDTQVLFAAGPPDARPYLSRRWSYGDGFFSRAVMLRPMSRGQLSLASADPAQPIRIHWNFLATEQDRRAMRATVRSVRAIGRQAPMAPFVARELFSSESDSDADLDAFIRATAMTVHHPLGTCRMGRAETGAVVDAQLRVHGIDRLRVVDASVMPDMIGGNINAAVIMIAEKAFDLIQGVAPPLAVSGLAG